MARSVAIIALLLVASVAWADTWKIKSCPSASPASAIGTNTGRRVLCLKNDDAANDICIGKASTITCNGTVGTDGFHLGPSQGICENEIAVGLPPASELRYCRAETADAVLSYKESHQ